jgi:hypothetical protein
MSHALKWKSVWKDALEGASAKLRAEASQNRFRDAAEQHKTALGSIVAAYVDGKIDEMTFTSELAIAKRDLRADIAGKSTEKSTAATAFFTIIEDCAREGATRAR